MIQSIRFKSACLGNLTDICRIEKTVHDHSSWSRQMFIDELNRENSFFLVLETILPESKISQQSKKLIVIGYMIWHVILDEAWLLNLAIDSPWQGKKLGWELLNQLIQKAKAWDLKTIILEVREDNQKAISLYKKQGFEQIGLRKNYYPGYKNALVYKLKLF